MTPSDSVQPDANRPQQDFELILRIKRGDKLAFSDFFDRFSRPLYSVALRILNDRSEAEAVVQETFLTLWEKAGSFEESRGSVLNWVITLTRNRAIERLRMRPQHAMVRSETPRDDVSSADSASRSDSASDPSLKDRILTAREALTKLPPDQLHALELAYFAGLNQQEFTSQKSEPTGTVRTQIRGGLLKLRILLTRTSDD